MIMLKRLAIIFVLLLITVGFSWLIYDQIFTGSGETTDDLTMVQVEGGFWDKESVEAECEIKADNQFCFKDTVWAEQQNEIEFEGYLVVDFTNTADIIEEISIGTVRFENVTPGILTIVSTDPSEIFIEPGQTARIRYDYLFDVSNDILDSTKSSGIELQTTFTNIIGKKASQVFTVEYR